MPSKKVYLGIEGKDYSLLQSYVSVFGEPQQLHHWGWCCPAFVILDGDLRGQKHTHNTSSSMHVLQMNITVKVEKAVSYVDDHGVPVDLNIAT